MFGESLTCIWCGWRWYLGMKRKVVYYMLKKCFAGEEAKTLTP